MRRPAEVVTPLTKVGLRAADGATAKVHLNGAHVTSWRPAPGDDERLFLSTRSSFDAGAAIRGGIPVIFPQFAAEGPLPRHGFARSGRYRESSAPGEFRFDDHEVIRVDGEIDRVYVDAPPRLTLREPWRELAIETTNFPDVVIWNPGAEKAADLEDLEPGGERRMLCIEAAAVQTLVAVEAGRRWSGTQTLIAQARLE